MLLTLTNTGHQATDLGFLLHKNPGNLHSAELTFGKAHVFYTAATAGRCTACLLLEIDPVELVRGAQRLEDYVNDRPYVSSSYLTVALGRIFGTALADNSRGGQNWSVRNRPSKSPSKQSTRATERIRFEKVSSLLGTRERMDSAQLPTP